MTPQVRIPVAAGAQFRRSAVCAAAGVLMVMGGVAGGDIINASHSQASGEVVEAPLVKVVHSTAQRPVTPGPFAPKPAQKPPAQKPQPAQKPPCTITHIGGTPSTHRGEPGYRPWVDDDHDDTPCD
ncbi:MAG: hypothetical protein ACRDS0_20370 [Pseudonocardiaceae bacterium]